MVARNSDFAWFAFSAAPSSRTASSRDATSSASIRLRSTTRPNWLAT